jgi:hypothetical protein
MFKYKYLFLSLIQFMCPSIDHIQYMCQFLAPLLFKCLFQYLFLGNLLDL